ncbi:cytoskeletal protein binding protein, partial [Kickxella alabastrina]
APTPTPPPPPSQTQAPRNSNTSTNSSTVSHFSVTEGKKKKGTKVILSVSNPTLTISSSNDMVPPKRHATMHISKCAAKKAVLGVEIGGYEPAAYDFTCASAAEAERIADAINAARRGMFIGDSVASPSDEAPPLPPKDTTVAPKAQQQSMPSLSHAEDAQEHALVLYEFASDDPEELTVDEGARVLVLDRSDPEWWQVQVAPPHGRAGLVPAAYLELQPAATESRASSVRERNDAPQLPTLPERTDTVRLAASQAHMAAPRTPELLSIVIDRNAQSTVSRTKTADSDNMPLQMLQNRQHINPPMPSLPSEPGPDPNKVRTWTDGSGAYTVDAQFLDLDASGNVHLHKTNGKTIVVPMAKFSPADRTYVDDLLGKAPQMPTKSLTARQRQQESARKDPAGKRMVNYDWDWFDFFTLKAGISADNALKYATSFVAERLDDQSIAEIESDTLRSLGVKPADIMRMDRAFRIHQGLPVSAIDPMSDEAALANAAASPAPAASLVPVFQQQPYRHQVPQKEELARSPASRALSPPGSQQSASQRVTSNPWGIDSELDRRFDRKRQIESDEALARKLQEEEKQRTSAPGGGRKPSNPQRPQQHDPFTNLNASGRSTVDQRNAAPRQALNLGSGTRKLNKSQTSVVDPAQLRSAQHRLASPPPALQSAAISKATTSTAFDEAFGSTISPQPQPEQHIPPRARPTARQQQQQSATINMPSQAQAPSLASALSNLDELTTNRMAAATASGNTAQINRLEQMAAAKAQELAAQEAHIRQQQEEIRKQAMFLQQQQHQLLQLQQTQKVESQLKQLKEEKDKLEQQRKAEEMKMQVEQLKSQQEHLLKMQQMASQARENAQVQQQQQQQLQQQQQQQLQLAAAARMLTPVSAVTPVQQQQIQHQPSQQQTVSLASRLPPPLVPSKMNRPMTSPSNHALFSNQQQIQQQQQQLQQQQALMQRQQFGGINPTSPAGMFSASQGITNMPAASSSTTGLVAPTGLGNIFTNQTGAGSTPNLGAFNKPPMLGANSLSGYANTAATHSVTSFGTNMQSGGAGNQTSHFLQQRMLQAPGAGTGTLTMGTQMNQQPGQVGSKYDLFKTINPNAPGVFNSNALQQPVGLQNSQFLSSSLLTTTGMAPYNPQQQQQQQGGIGSGVSRSVGPTGIFAMANPTLGQNQQQQPQQQHIFANQMFNSQMQQPQQQLPHQQQQQPQQQQQQNMFNANQAAGFGNQMQWH